MSYCHMGVIRNIYNAARFTVKTCIIIDIVEFLYCVLLILGTLPNTRNNSTRRLLCTSRIIKLHHIVLMPISEPQIYDYKFSHP